MKLLLRLLAMLAAMGIFLFRWNKPEPYYLIAAGVGLIAGVICWIVFWPKHVEGSDAEETKALNQEEALPLIFKSILIFAVTLGVAYGAAEGGKKIPGLYDRFYDRDYETFIMSVAQVAGAPMNDVRNATHPDQAADMILDRFTTVPDMLPDQAEELALWRYNLLIKKALMKTDEDEKKVAMNEAKAWGNEHGIDTSLLEETVALMVPPPTPLPPIVVTPVIPPTPSSIVIQDGQVAFKSVHQDGLVLSCTIQVKDSNGQFVPNLGRYDIRVSVMTPNGQVFVEPQNVGVVPIKDLQVPVYNRLYIDISKSMLQVKVDGDPVAFEAARSAMLGYVRTLRPIDYVEVVQFGHEVTASGWMSPDEAAALIQSIEATGENTLLYDAMSTITPVDGPQIAVVLSDGKDTGSHASASDAAEAMRKSGAAIYGVALKSAEYDGSGVSNLVQNAGGVPYTAESATQLSEIFLDVASQTQSLYRVQILLPTEVITSVSLEVGTNTIGPYLIYK